MKKSVTFQFPTIQMLWQFRAEIQPKFFELYTRERLLTCECDTHDIELATAKFHGIVFNGEINKEIKAVH